MKYSSSKFLNHVKELLKYFFIVFFLFTKMAYYLLVKIQRKISKRSKQQISKSFWKRKQQKRKKARERYQNFTKEEKEKGVIKNLSKEQKKNLVGYRRNCYLTQNK